MTVEIESILQHEDIQGLLENAESTGSVKQPELAELIEAHQLDALETETLFNELERRGIDVVVEEPEKRRSPLLPRSRPRTRRRPTRCSSSCARPAATHC